ncbi:MAG: gliding motility-associated C-terminal domain-containing protein [Bacteroidota bacterium]
MYDPDGCGTFKTEFVPTSTVPELDITPTDITRCDVGNGEITVEVAAGTSGTGYSLEIFEGVDNTGVSLASLPLSPINTPLTVSNLDPGTYYIELIDGDNPTCPMGEIQVLSRIVAPPVLSSSIVAPNTSCDPTLGADGEVQLTATSANGDVQAKNYQVTAVSLAIAGFSTPDPIGTGASGQSEVIVNLEPEAYTFTVTDANSSCEADILVVVPDAQDVPSNLNVVPAAETACAPLSNGSATASLAGGEAVTIFDFNWFLNADGTGSVLAGGTPLAGGGGTTGELLNQGKVPAPANWPLGATGFGSGNRTYYVRGVKNATAPSGVGCPTELKQVVIPDEHLSPNIDLTSTFNSFCAALVPGSGDGSISIEADPDGATGAIEAANFTFVLDVDPNGINGTGPVTNVANGAPITIPDLGTGSYEITATNVATGCGVINSIAVQDAPFFIQITDTDFANQLICNPNGQADVVEVTINKTAASLANVVENNGLPLTNVYDFEWFAATPGNPNTFVNTPLEDNANNPINEQSLVTGTGAGQYPTMGAGTYYVIATRRIGSGDAEGCPSLPVRIDVADEHKNPVVTLTPFSNTSCLPGTGEGQIEVTVTDATNPAAPGFAATFDYDWAAIITDSNGNNGNATNDGDDDVIVNLEEANYSVTVTNPTTGCATLGTAEIRKNATPVFVQTVDSTPQVSCDPAGDGSLELTEVSLNDRNGNQQSTALPVPNNLVFGDFEFDWTRVGNPFTQTTAGTVLDVGTYDASGAGFNTPIGAGTYTVVARRINGSPGRDCESAPFQVLIQDNRMYPTATMLPLSNTSCDPAFFEGEILITADDQTSIAGPNSFTYTWTTSATPAVLPVGSVSVASDGDADGTDGDDDHPTSLIEGNYQITVTSLKSQCTNVASTTIFKNATPVFVQQVDSRDQVLCTPDGRLEVTQVTLNDRNGNVQTTPVQLLFNEFEFTWTRTASTLNFTEAPGVAVLDGANFPAASGTIGAGEYFVVAKRIAGSPGRDCESAPYKVDILDRRIFPVATLTPFANTSCDPLFFEGEVAVNVTDASVNLPAPLPGAPFNYSYEWLQSATAALPVGPVPGVHDGDGDASDGDGDHPLALSEGAYRIRVTNIQTGCTADAATTIFRNGTPVFTQQVDATNQVLCGNDGALQITNLRIIDRDGNEQTSGNGDFPVSDFDFEWFRGTPTNSVATGDGNLGAASGGTILDAAHYPAIGFDTYYVVSTRTNGSPGKDCFSTPYKVDILDRRIFPVATLTPFANTSCDPTFFEGAISLRVTDQTTVPGPFTYTYTWDPGNPTAIPLINPGLNDGDADGADGDQDNPGGLEDGVYNVLVRNNQTGCESPAVTTIFRNATPIFIPQATAQPQVLCLADGSVEVDIVEVTDRDGVTQVAPLSDFDFSWSRATLANVVATTVGANGAVSGGTILDATAYNQIGFDAYYIVARRVANGPGLGCESAPYKVDILDRRLFPEVTFVPTANSSCSDLKPNGALQADAREMNGANAGPYIFAWQLDGGAVSPASTQTDTNNSSLLGSALDGVYTVTATNTVTGCPVDANFTLTLDQTRSTPNIIDVNTIDPLDCNPSAQAEVTRITLGGTTNSTLFPPNIPPDNTVTGAALNNFIFEWYDGGFAPSALIAGQTAPLITGLSARTYYVIVQDPATDCKSGPKEVIINDDDIIYPVADIQQTIKQISCTTPGSAELLATGDGQTIIPYTFQWFNSLDLSGPVLANVPQIGQLSAGEYSVNVTNTVTGCSSSAYYIIPDEADLYRPIVSLGGSPRTLCVGEDGSVLARVINLDPTYPFPYTFTADLYNGTPSISTDPNTVPPPADFPNMALVPGFVGNFLQSSLPEGTYTVRLVDNNTGCVTVAVGEVEDERVLPVVEVVELNPLINCDPNRANGQLAATADGGRIVGYTFDWYEGSTVPNPPGTPLEADTDQLIGYGVYGQDVSYVVRVTNNFTQCFSDKAGTITDGTVEPPMPTPETVFDRTNCIDPNGWLTVSVDGVVFNYTFNWYNGTVATGSPAFTGIDYRLLDVGNYAVTATDDVTGCVSPPATLPVLDKRLIPEFNIVTTPSFCVDTGRPNGNGSVILTVTNNAILTDVQWYDVNSNANVASGTAYYELFPGVYRAEVVTNEGCTNEGTAEVGTEIAPYNGISSNGDNLNDFFIIDCITNFPNNNVKIYNRSGILVYEVDGYNNADLSFKGIGERGVYLQGTDLPVGTYFYIIDKRDGSKPVAGYLELDR